MSGSNQKPIIVIRKIRKASHGGHHGGAWKVAYADFVTAMMAFFMLLWLVSNPDDARLKGLAEYFSPENPSEAAGRDSAKIPMPSAAPRTAGKPDPMSAGSSTQTVGTSRGGTADIPDAALRVMAQEMKLAIDSLAEVQNAKDSVTVEVARDGVRITLMDTSKLSMFQGATAKFNDYALKMLSAITRKIAPLKAQIAIEGHTDSVGGQSEGNWRLSAERALAARTVMAQAGMLPDRFAEVVAVAGADPLYTDQPDRPENRRITIVVLAEPPSHPNDVSFKF
jgi:chemotaxis protein MotB